MNNNLSNIADQFAFDGKLEKIAPYGFGHINKTYEACYKMGNGVHRRYILQQINHQVFKQPELVMSNLTKVTSYLSKKIIETGGDPLRETINIIPTRTGDAFLRAENGDYWRAEVFIEGAQTYQTPQDPSHYYQASRAFGRFGKWLADFPITELAITIPDFHNTPVRFQAFLEAVAQDACNRCISSQEEIDFILQRESQMGVLMKMYERQELILRVTHNDTKFENVMIDDQTGHGICVIDLDTVMPGLIVFDFGDAVRSGANPAAEDEADLRLVEFNLSVYEHLVRGYLDGARDFLTSLEIDYLTFAARLITLEQAMRFLTDHLNGDIYYRIHRRDHNLDRCRTQIKLVKDMESRFDSMELIINKYRR